MWGFALFGGTIATIVLAIVAFTASVQDRAPDLPDEAILYLDLNTPLVEHVGTEPIFQTSYASTVLDVVESIRKAAKHDAVKALAIGVGGSPLSFAHAQEIADAIQDFRQSGKPSFAYSDDLGAFGDSLPDLMVATAVETLWVNPTGMLGLTGVSIEVPYAAQALEDIGVNAEFEQRFEYKGGADPLTLSRMPVPVRRSLTALAQGLVEEATRIIGRGREIPAETVETLMRQGPFIARRAQEAGLVDVLDYEDAFDAAVEEAVDGVPTWIDSDLLLAAAADSAAEDWADGNADPVEIAVVYGVGAIGIGDESDPFSDSGFDVWGVIDALDLVTSDEDYDAVLFRVASPGGAYGPSDLVWRAIHKVRDAGIPVVVSMGDTAASGGYFVSAGADRIVASPSTITGSIGVYGGKFDTQKLWESIGVRWESVEIGPNAGMFSNFRPFDPGERRAFAESIDFVYEDFTSKVGADRNLAGQALDEAARGRIFTGRDAQAVGLVDRLGGFTSAVEEIMVLLGQPVDGPYRLTILPEPQEAWEVFAEALESGDVPYILDRVLAGAVMRRVSNYTQAMFGEAATVLHPRGLVSMPPIVVNP